MPAQARNDFATATTLVLVMLLCSGVSAQAYGTDGAFEAHGGKSLAAGSTEETVSVTVAAGPYTITHSRNGHDVAVEDFGCLLVPGKPKLPTRIFAIAVPPGAEVTGIRCDTGAGILLPGGYDIPPAPLPRVIGQEDPAVRLKQLQRYQANFDVVYGSDDAYPGNVAEFVRCAHYRKYNLADVRVSPFAYRPLSRQLIYYPEITVHVDYRPGQPTGDAMVDNLVRTERIARDIIVNPDQARQWYAQRASSERGANDFVIITLDSLTSSVTPLANWETYKGRTVQVVTTSWISANYTGYDLAEQMRNFLRDKYPSAEWGIEDVLFVGHYDDVPMRRTWQDLGYGRPETDFYYAELSLPDDQSWDADGDHRYGEYSDPIDFYAEVNVGRIPWSDPATVLSICQKSAAFEQNNDASFKKNILLLGAYFWPDTDNAVLMEAKVDQAWMADWTMTRMYEQNEDYWSSYPCDYPLSRGRVLSVWPTGTYAFVNWAGHGSPTSCHILGLSAPSFIQSSDCPSLNDNYPAIIFADACSNSDTDHLNIGQAMLQSGAVGFVGATQVAYGCGAWDNPSDGSSQSLDYYFTTSVTSGDYTQGAALQWALRQMYTQGLWDSLKYETFQWAALWGNPNLGVAPVLLLDIAFPDGLPEYLTPGAAATLTVGIEEIDDTYIPGSGTFHYRYDGGTYLTSALVPVGGDLYEATLPAASCAASPEFYVSAEGLTAGVINSPLDAPANVHTAFVGEKVTVLDDDFETDQSWTVDAGATAGNWERADPQEVVTPWVPRVTTQPEDDHTPDGTLCYVTEATAGGDPLDYEVDGGPTRLTSPILQLQGNNATVSYWRWYRIGATLDDQLVVEVSNDNGGSWVTVETLSEPETWTFVEWRVDEYVTPTNEVRVRFTASDETNNSLVEALVDDFVATMDECTQPMGNGDFDEDDDVDLTDFARFQECFEQYPLPSACGPGDMNGSGRVDATDYALFVDALEGLR